jgi:hypothetical protein
MPEQYYKDTQKTLMYGCALIIGLGIAGHYVQKYDQQIYKTQKVIVSELEKIISKEVTK